AVLLYGGLAQARDLAVCIDTSSPMVAIDHQLAQAVARHAGVALRVHEYNSQDNDEVNGMADFSRLTARDCALVLDFPLDTTAPPGALGSLEATKPYAHTGFVLVTPKGSHATTLGQLPRGSKVAVTYMTTPNIYFSERPDLHPDVELHDPATLDALAAGKATAAMVWHPALFKYLAAHAAMKDKFAVHPLTEPHAQFNLVALYDKQHAAAAAGFDASIAALRASGELQKILGRYAKAGAAPASTPSAPGASDPGTSAASGASGGAASGARDPQPAASAAASSPSASPSTSSSKPALYTAPQATTGKQQYLANCAMCHGALLDGFVGPALKGKHFAPPSADYHVSDIFTIVANNMPADQPGSLDHKTYVQVMAYVLQQNGYPAGTQALTYEGAMKSKAKFISEAK
ncbi:MAG: c-type cytochrome, partial [Rhodanobacteraceae bacterium]